MRRARTRRQRARSDVAATTEACVSARVKAPAGHAGGCVYVLPGHEDEPFVVHRVNRRAVTLRGAGGGFLVFEGEHRPRDDYWVMPCARG